ncbi:MAG: anti-sigma factor family protein [Planctomycetota bacterium]
MASDHLDDDLLQSWAEGGLPPEDETAAGRHLAECPDCRETAETYRALLSRNHGSRPSGEEGPARGDADGFESGRRGCCCSRPSRCCHAA